MFHASINQKKAEMAILRPEKMKDKKIQMTNR